MNYIQRGWMRVLAGPANFINNNLAKREGLIGRAGRFWAMGSRQNGYHVSTRVVQYFNKLYLYTLYQFFSRQPMMKTFMMKNNYMNGYFTFLRLMDYAMGWIMLMIPFFLLNRRRYDRNEMFIF